MTPQQLAFVEHLLDKRYRSELLFSGSEDNFSASKFHEKCDKKGPTLTLIKSTLGHIFGGYTSADWVSEIKYTIDPHSFLFSVTHLTKHE